MIFSAVLGYLSVLPRTLLAEDLDRKFWHKRIELSCEFSINIFINRRC